MDTLDEYSYLPESTDVLPHLLNNSPKDEEVTESVSLPMNVPGDEQTHLRDNSKDEIHSKISEESMMDQQSNARLKEDDTIIVSSVPAVEKTADEIQTYECPCGELFLKTTELAAHKRWSCKLAEKKCQCDVCKGWFAHEQSLRRHMKHAHGGVFPCDSCSLRFHNKMRLTRHWMEEHYDEKLVDKKLKCFICNKAQFNSKYELECHLLAHKYCKQNSVISTAAPNQDTLRTQRVSHSPTIAQTPQHYFHGSEARAFFPFSHWRHHRHGSFQHQFPSPAASNGPFGVLKQFCHPPPHGEQSVVPSDIRPSSFHPPPPPPPSPHETSHHNHPYPPPPPPLSHPPPPPSHPPPPSSSLEESQHDHPYPSSPLAPPLLPHPLQHDSMPPLKTFHPFDLKSFPSFPPPPPPPIPSPPPPPPPIHPHHNHFIPPYFPFHAYPIMKKFYKHQNKMKWKNYFKTMMSHTPSHWYAASPGSATWNHHSQSAHQNYNANTASFTNATSEDGIVTCEFCGETMHLKYIHCHKRRRCPVLCVHKCAVCGKAFASHNILLRHMSRQGHTYPSDINAISMQGDGESSSISGLQEKLKTVLNFPKAGAPDEKKAHHLRPMSESNQSKLIPKISITKASDDLASDSEESIRDTAASQSSKISCNIDYTGSERALVIDENLSDTFTCFVCRCAVRTKSDIEQHLLDHLAHVESVQKVQEWTEKSAKYFLDEDVSEVDSTYTSGDTNEFSSTTSVPAEFDCGSNISSRLSSFSNAKRETDKWMKPHGKHKHTKLKRQVFPCDVCNETFAFRKELHYHMKNKHTDYTLDCPICHKSFSWKNRAKFYERHMKSHYGVAVFKHKCHLCGKTFLENHKLQAHMSKHKTELLHTCNTCGKGYGNKSSLIRHQRKHTGDKPHQCHVCNETFWEKRELIRHSTSHTGTAPFVCSNCGQGFTLKTSLMKHVKRKHP